MNRRLSTARFIFIECVDNAFAFQTSDHEDMWLTKASAWANVCSQLAAIAMEAQRGETPKSGSTAEGGDSAGPKDIAQ